MNAYQEMLKSMMAAILSQDTAKAAALFKDRDGFLTGQQLAVYCDAYSLRLIDIIREIYPALQHFLGGREFTRLAEAYVRVHPSRFYNIDQYALAFADFIRKECSGTTAREIALLEQAVAWVYNAPDSPPIAPDWSLSQTEETFAATCFVPRTASKLLAFTLPVNDYAAQVRAGENPAISEASSNWLMIYRHRHQVQRLVLDEGEYGLLMLLDGSTSLKAALEDERFAPFSENALQNGDFMRWFSRWTRKGCLIQP